MSNNKEDKRKNCLSNVDNYSTKSYSKTNNNEEDLASFTLDSPNYSVKQLSVDSAAILQQLYDCSHDFAHLTYGTNFAANAARQEFNDLPPGKTPEDIYVFGLFDSTNIIVGTIIAVRNYPNQQTWWIGTMMLAPDHRKQGLGTKFYQAFETWVVAQKVAHISLCVIEENKVGLKFWQKLGFTITRQTEPKIYGKKTHRLYVLSRTIKPRNLL